MSVTITLISKEVAAINNIIIYKYYNLNNILFLYYSNKK